MRRRCRHVGAARLRSRKAEDKTILQGVQSTYWLSKDGGKLLYKSGETFGIVETTPDHKVGDDKIESGTLMANVDPRAEWKQMFEEAWRLERDFYYDPAMGGLDWKAVGARYRSLVPYLAHRHDLNYLLGELIGELSTSHAFRRWRRVSRSTNAHRSARLRLGARRGSGRYRFERSIAPRLDSKTHAPLGEPGVLVKEGTIVGRERPAARGADNVYAAFVGTVDHQTTITVGSKPTSEAANLHREPIGSEITLRYTDWSRQPHKVEEAPAADRLLHGPNTATAGIQEFSKQYYPNRQAGIIVDERFNGGGSPGFFVERLSRTTWTTGRRATGWTSATQAVRSTAPSASW